MRWAFVKLAMRIPPQAMDEHTETKTEMQEILQASRRQQKMMGLLIAGVVHAALAAVLALFVLPLAPTPEPDVIVSVAAPETQTKPQRRTISSLQQPERPSSPSSAAAKIITASAASPIAVPTVQVPLNDGLVGLGMEGAGFGSGFGMGGGGTGLGGTFFGNKADGKHICFVVDVSASMSNQQMRLMKDELTRSLRGLPAGTRYQVIFFSGPVWFAEQEITFEGRSRAVVKGQGGKKLIWEGQNGRATSFQFGNGKEPLPAQPWRLAKPSALSQSIRSVENVSRSFGTTWRMPLRMALTMDPKPEVIYFMTDGVVNRAAEDVREITRLNRRGAGKAKIFTTAMMQPKAAEQLHELADKNGGTFSIVRGDGSVVTGKDALRP